MGIIGWGRVWSLCFLAKLTLWKTPGVPHDNTDTSALTSCPAKTRIRCFINLFKKKERKVTSVMNTKVQLLLMIKKETLSHCFLLRVSISSIFQRGHDIVFQGGPFLPDFWGYIVLFVFQLSSLLTRNIFFIIILHNIFHLIVMFLF